MNQYTLVSDAMARGQRLGIYVEKRTLLCNNRSTTITYSQNKLTKTSIAVRLNFNPMKDDDTLFYEAKVNRGAQRSDNLQMISPFNLFDQEILVSLVYLMSFVYMVLLYGHGLHISADFYQNFHMHLKLISKNKKLL